MYVYIFESMLASGINFLAFYIIDDRKQYKAPHIQYKRCKKEKARICAVVLFGKSLLANKSKQKQKFY